MAFVFDTSVLPENERVEAIHTAMMYASAPCHVIHEDPAGTVHARMEVWDLGGANIFTQRSSGIRLLRTGKLARQDAMPVLALSVQQRAEGRLEQGGEQRVVGPGQLLAVDLSGPYDFSWPGDGAAGCLQIPFEQLGLPVDTVRAAARHVGRSPLTRMVADHITNLARDPARITGDPPAAPVAAASLDLARALVASAAGNARPARDVLAETLVSRIRAYTRRHLTDPDLNPAVIAAAHNVSVRQLYKVCSAAGFSLEQWIITLRLQGARHELLLPDRRHRPIAAVARSWGFRDATHFTRRFKARYGMSPSQWRASSAEART